MKESAMRSDNPFYTPALPGRALRRARHSWRSKRSKAWRHGYLVLKDAYIRWCGAIHGEDWNIATAPPAFWGLHHGYEPAIIEIHARAVYRGLSNRQPIHPDALLSYPLMRKAFLDAGWTFEVVGPTRIAVMDRRPFVFGGDSLPDPVIPTFSVAWIRLDTLIR